MLGPKSLEHLVYLGPSTDCITYLHDAGRGSVEHIGYHAVGTQHESGPLPQVGGVILLRVIAGHIHGRGLGSPPASLWHQGVHVPLSRVPLLILLAPVLIVDQV